MASNRGRAWADTRLEGTSLIAGTPLVLDLLAGAPTVDTLTVIRLILNIKVQYTPNSTVTDSLSICDLGVGVSSVDAFNAGFVALPSPTVPTEYPPRGWLFVDSEAVSQQAESAGVLNEVTRFKADLRASRKIDKGTLFLVAENTNILVGGSMRLTGRVRALCLT